MVIVPERIDFINRNNNNMTIRHNGNPRRDRVPVRFCGMIGVMVLS